MSVEAILLGTAQDGGLPQAGCDCDHCRAAHADPAGAAWWPAWPWWTAATRQSWLIDATPDFREQLHALQQLAPDCPLAGIALTHAHMGHYAGLIHLGREAWGTRRLPVYASARMARFLTENAPWSQLVALGNVELRPLVPTGGAPQPPPVAAAPGRAPPRRVRRHPGLRSRRAGPGGCSTALTSTPGSAGIATCGPLSAGWTSPCWTVPFSAPDELPGRNLAEIPHPLATDTAGRLAGVDCDVRLIHLNHSNPLHHAGPERAWLAEQGIGVGAQGDRWTLA